MADVIAVLDKVSYKYPRSPGLVLSNISLEIYKGEFLGVVGPTGAGKSTLCLTLNGIVPQFYGGDFYGSVHVNGLDTVENPISKLACCVGSVFEDPETQLIATSVENEIAFPLENLKVPVDEIRRRIPRVLDMVRLSGYEKKSPAELSGGQKQRLAIAAGLAVQPSLLVLDEPTSQIDPMGAQEVFAVVRELNRQFGMTIVMCSHAAEEMAEYADRLALLVGGRLLALGTPDEIYPQVQLLEENQVRPPQVCSVFYALRQKRLPVQDIPVRLEEGKQALRSVLQGGRLLPPPDFPAPPAPEGTPLFSVKNLRHVYPDGTQALHGISLDIRKGEYVLIIGQNGAGKSTLVKHFLSILRPTEGSVMIDGVDTQQLKVSQLARRIGYVAQNPDNQIFNETVEKEVSFALTALGHVPQVVTERTHASLRAMGLEEVKDRHPLSLPKGERARVVIAAILAMQPEIIIFDEPTTGQDYRGARYILDISRQLHQMGKTVIVITHHLYLMPEYAQRVIVMGKGTILLDAPIRTAYHDTQTLESTFLTPPQTVLLAKELERLDGRVYPLLTPAELAGCFEWQNGYIG